METYHSLHYTKFRLKYHILPWHNDSKAWKNLYWTAEETMEITKKKIYKAHGTDTRNMKTEKENTIQTHLD